MAHTYRDDFPLLNSLDIAYLDNAATAQRPQCVLDAVADFYRCHNANPLRGLYPLSVEATDIYEQARETVRDFIGARSAREIVFTRNTTESLNLVAYSYGMNFLHEGDEIVISVAAHHSNMVPWQRVAKATGAKLVYMYPGENGRLTTEELDKKITPKTKVVAVAMVSNVLGLRAPVEEIVKRAHAVGAVVVLDCAQSAPHPPVAVKKLDVDFAACSAHKLYAPMGVGALYARAGLLEKMPPFMSGGDMIGAVHESGATWADGPRKFEAGTRNVGGEVGFAAAIEYMKEVPTTWDETRFIDGYPGRYCVLARRHGDRWYIAGVNAGKEPLELKLRLPMFDKGTNLHSYTDNWKSLALEEGQLTVKNPEAVRVTLQPNGGMVLTGE